MEDSSDIIQTILTHTHGRKATGQSMATIYCWGNTTHGELGLGGIENEQILTPRKMHWCAESDGVRQVACGRWHTLFLTNNGRVYSCGSNDNGQLGHDQPTKRPQLISELQNYDITQISCGGRHSLAVNDWGQLFAWGHNDYGQLGLGNTADVEQTPKIVKSLLSSVIVQVASGNNHNLALSNSGELYAWGSNIYGQLGTAMPQKLAHATTPQLVESLRGIPIAFIACGGNHSFMISKSGAVFGWGRNNCGQLGLNDDQNRCFPTQLKTLRSLGVRYISCGDEFSVFLTVDGGVFTCGLGTYGQLGHGGNANEVLPRMVVELMGSTITQIACGERHTLALVPSRGRVYGFGLGSSGQLGTRLNKNATIPQVVVGPWVSPSGHTLIHTEKIDLIETPVIIHQIFSGGDHALVTTTDFADKVPAVDCRIYEPKTQILHLTSECARLCSEIKPEASFDLDLLNTVELIFYSQACLNGSFLLTEDKHSCCTSKHPGVDLTEATRAFEYLRKVENESIKFTILDKVTNDLLPTLSSSPPDVETLRIYLLLPLYHEFVNSKNYEKLHSPFSNAVLHLNEIPRKILGLWWCQAPAEWFEHMVTIYKDVVTHIISFKISPNIDCDSGKRIVTYNTNLKTSLDMLDLLYRMNHKLRKNKLPDEIFIWQELVDYVDLQQNYIQWIFKNQDAFNICKYPFLFNASAKTTLLQTDQAIQMHNAMQNATNISLFSLLTYGSTPSQYLVLNVSRENLIQDTLREILQHSAESDLKKPLKVKFHNEEAEDAGGVRKEFFLLLLKELIDPKYGMFKEFENSRIMWFADVTFETENMYILIGVICGLAIYNFTIINLPFPLALYKKLLGEPVDLSDLLELSPVLGKSMQSILDYEGDDMEEVFDLRFEITRDIYGESKTEPLKPNGENIAVTLENKKDFVDLYVDFIFNKAVQSQFKAFYDGFMKVCSGRVLQLFKPEELMAMVVGNEEYDWHALESNCEYKNGYTSGDQTVQWFWEVFHELPIAEKKQFLLYLTGCDRIPIQGMKAIKLCIQPTSDERFLPVAHTCFNLLDLPRYQTKERLKYKLRLAIQQTQGFHLV